MKANIKNYIESLIHDNKVYIKIEGSNIAEYLLKDARNAERGWFDYLNDDEIELFESDNTQKNRLIGEITTYIIDNFDYEL